jgi:hypothetical protein
MYFYCTYHPITRPSTAMYTGRHQSRVAHHDRGFDRHRRN